MLWKLTFVASFIERVALSQMAPYLSTNYKLFTHIIEFLCMLITKITNKNSKKKMKQETRKNKFKTSFKKITLKIQDI